MRLESSSKILSVIMLLGFLLLICVYVSWAQEPALQQPQDFRAVDAPNDDGTSVCLLWALSPDDKEDVDYIISSATAEAGPFKDLKRIPSTTKFQSDYPEFFGFSRELKKTHCLQVGYPRERKTRVPIPTWFKLEIVKGEQRIAASNTATTIPLNNWIAWNKMNNFVLVLVLFVGIGYCIHRARKNPNMFIRRIPGLEAVDEAVGRATEMGRPLLYLTGAYEISELSTLASVNILRRVAETVAQYDSRLINPHRRSITMTICQEVIREAYVKAGRPDAFRQEDVYFVTEDAFGFVAAADGIMVREKPAANFYLGTFSAESLLLAETGAMTGAIQIAGTDSAYQIPFFIVSCDYTLIGEELYAASAYLSREPKLLGTLRGQDFGKVVCMAALIVSTLGVCIYSFTQSGEWLLWLKHFFTKL